MTRIRIILAAGAATAAILLAGPLAAHPDQATKEEVREIKIVKSDKVGKHAGKRELVANCGEGRKFESKSTSGDGAKEKRVNKMVICSDPGESDEAWAKTLRDALARVEADTNMPADGKAQIMADLRSELAKLGK